MLPIPDDVIPLIINNLDIRSIGSFRRICKGSNYNVDWNNYFLSKTKIPEMYKNYSIDEKFMRKHGKYLVKIEYPYIVKQWFRYYPSINNILSKYKTFIVEPKYYIFVIHITHQEEVYSLVYNKRSGSLEVSVGNRYTAHIWNIEKTICEKLKERMLSYDTFLSIEVKINDIRFYFDSTL